MIYYLHQQLWYYRSIIFFTKFCIWRLLRHLSPHFVRLFYFFWKFLPGFISVPSCLWSRDPSWFHWQSCCQLEYIKAFLWILASSIHCFNTNEVILAKQSFIIMKAEVVLHMMSVWIITSSFRIIKTRFWFWSNFP